MNVLNYYHLAKANINRYSTGIGLNQFLLKRSTAFGFSQNKWSVLKCLENNNLAKANP